MGSITRDFANNVTLTKGSGLAKVSSSSSDSSVASAEIALPTDYQWFTLVIAQVLPATDGAKLQLTFSTDGGSSYLSGTANYSWVNQGVAGSGGDYSEHNSKATSYAGLQKSGMGNDSAEGGAFTINIVPKRTGSHATRGNYYWGAGHRYDTGDNYRGFYFNGQIRDTNNDIDYVKLAYDSGNISSLTYTLYGAKN